MAEPGIIVLHYLLWKFIIIRLTQISLENHKAEFDDCWGAALRRLRRKFLSYAEVKARIRRTSIARGEKKIPDCSEWSGPVRPLAELTEHGDLEWSENMKIELSKIDDEQP